MTDVRARTGAAASLLARVAAEPTYLTYQTTARDLRALGPDALAIPPQRRARVALIGSCTLEPWAAYLLVEALRDGVWLDVFCGGFNQFQSELLDTASALYAFAPEIVFVAAELAAIVPEPANGPAADAALGRVEELTAAFTRHSRALLVWQNFIVPVGPPYGVASPPEAGKISVLNDRLRERFAEHAQVRVLDLDRLASFHGKGRLADPRLAALARLPWSPDFLPHLSRAALSFVKAAKGLTRKVLVLDLDGTLWGGIVGEDGIEGLDLGDEAPGSAYLDFQRAVLALRARGVLLAINSKNNPADALAVLREHPRMLLREEHFAAMRINWRDKATNMRELAAELKLGLDSLVFIDDQAAERHLIRELLPEVLTPEWPADPTRFVAALEALNDFERLQTTAEDLQRAALYQAERARDSLRTQVASFDDYLASLETVATVRPSTPAEVPRIAQLTQKTNQFNLTTRRYSERELHDLATMADARVYTLRVRDRFGDAGLVGVAIVRVHNPSKAGLRRTWLLDTLLMSCRVMGRRIEHALLGALASFAREAGAVELHGDYRATARNAVAADLYEQAGFDFHGRDGDTTRWRLDLAAGRLPGEPRITVAVGDE